MSRMACQEKKAKGVSLNIIINIQFYLKWNEIYLIILFQQSVEAVKFHLIGRIIFN